MFLIHSGLIGESGRIPLLLFLYASFFCFVITRKKKKKLWLFRLLLCVLICSCIFLMVLTLLDVGCICSWSKASFLTHTVALIITGTSVPLGGMLMCRMFWCTFLLRLTFILLHFDGSVWWFRYYSCFFKPSNTQGYYRSDSYLYWVTSLNPFIRLQFFLTSYLCSVIVLLFFMLVNVTLHSGFIWLNFLRNVENLHLLLYSCVKPFFCHYFSDQVMLI